jgi:protein SCO1/2
LRRREEAAAGRGRRRSAAFAEAGASSYIPGAMTVSPAQRALLVFGIGALVLAIGLSIAFWSMSRGGGPLETAGSASIGGDFALVDQHGETRRPADFRGKLMLVFFGYTYCPDVCPTELQVMSEALDQLGAEAAGVTPIFITIDPARDTPEQLRLYAESFHPQLVALTGSPEAVAEAARAYKVYFAKRPLEDGDYLMDHSSFVFLMDREGRYLMHFNPATTPEQLATALSKRL